MHGPANGLKLARRRPELRAIITPHFQNPVIEIQPLHASTTIPEGKRDPPFRSTARGIRKPDFVNFREVGEFRSQIPYFLIDPAIRKTGLLCFQQQYALVCWRSYELRDL